MTSLDLNKYRLGYQDPFHKLPHEIKVEVFRYLTSTDIFSLKQASLSVHLVELPSLMYKRFIQEEFNYFPPLMTAIKRLTQSSQDIRVDWRATFERVRKSIRTPEPGDGSEWDEIDINLKNRNRIWKIVKPMAEEFVESCPSVLRQKYGVPVQLANRTSVVRSYVGTRSGREGVAESAYFGERAKKISKYIYADDEDEDSEDEVEAEDGVVGTDLIKVRIYLSNAKEVDSGLGLLRSDIKEGSQIVCGIGFLIVDEEEEGIHIRRFGRRSFHFKDIEIPPGKSLIGFVFCFTENVVSGIRLVFGDSNLSELSEFSQPIGKWGGVMRKIVADPDCRILVGVTGFINSSGFIEKIGLLETTLTRKTSDQYGTIPIDLLQVELSHEESSVWRVLPPTPTKLHFLEREGPKIRNWREHMAEWEVWQSGYEGEGVVLSPSQPTRKDLCEMIGYYDNEFLRGLSFIYDTPSGKEESSIGVTKARTRGSFKLCLGEKISAAVISFGVGGIHGILVG